MTVHTAAGTTRLFLRPVLRLLSVPISCLELRYPRGSDCKHLTMFGTACNCVCRQSTVIRMKYGSNTSDTYGHHENNDRGSRDARSVVVASEFCFLFLACKSGDFKEKERERACDCKRAQNNCRYVYCSRHANKFHTKVRERFSRVCFCCRLRSSVSILVAKQC